MIKVLTSISLLLGAANFAIAQKQVEVRDQTWFGYFNQARFTNKSGLWVDLHWRLTGNFTEETSINMGRVGYIYYLSDQTRIAIGYAYANHHSHGGSSPNTPEHRPWQQIQWLEKKNGFNLTQALRM